jgi:hypothetical protein
VILKEKGWLWKLTGPFASSNYTTIGHTIYYPKGKPPSAKIILHEEIHEKQWMQVGFFKFYFLYLFCLPVGWNPWRKKWELEAYMKSEAIGEALALGRISGKSYGWIA